MREKTCFDILSVHEGVSLEEAKQAYKHLVKRWHPDQYANDLEKQRVAQEKLKEINVAYRELRGILKKATGSTVLFTEPKTENPGTPERCNGNLKKQTFLQRMASFFQTRPDDNAKSDDEFMRGHPGSSSGARRNAKDVPGTGRQKTEFNQILKRTLRNRPRGPAYRRAAADGTKKSGRKAARQEYRRDGTFRTPVTQDRNAGDRIEKIRPVRPVGKI